ncbi:hypothetical protein [Pararhizobium sp.]|uniref:hypothetical protein n=1 Tax=Pararhizobium sp. TaxID=1977563 RepID=UPI002718A85A|nr:hypothetical protein [Pararhizobium sp.]MDO9418493.1 hypothetical protein [Pararhizobium sp.]
MPDDHDTKKRHRNRHKRGEDFTLEQFRDKYSLSDDDAQRIFKVGGPSSLNLDAVMKAKAERG